MSHGSFPPTPVRRPSFRGFTVVTMTKTKSKARQKRSMNETMADTAPPTPLEQASNDGERASEVGNETMTDTTPPTSEASNEDEDAVKFYKGQRVFAKDETSGILYEAVVRRTMFGIARQRQVHMLAEVNEEEEEEKEEWHCFVHYLGWNVSWDRWVSEGAIYELTDKNRELAEKLQQAVKDAKKKHGRKSPHIMVELAQRMKQLEQERRLEERREELAKQGIIMQEQDEEKVETETTTKFTKAYFRKELALREQDLQRKRKQSHAEKLVLPFSLKKILVEEWEVITQCGQVPTLPVANAVTIRQVLDNYLASKIDKPVAGDSLDPVTNESTMEGRGEESKQVSAGPGSSNETSPKQVPATAAKTKNKKLEEELSKDELTKKQEQDWQDMVDGIALLFDQAVGSHLLYRQELPIHEWIQQHEDFGTRQYCQVYGCEHLLRLFIRLPALLADQLSDAEARPIFSKLNDFVRFLQKHQAKIFLQSYQTPSLENEPSKKRASDGTSKRSAKRSRKTPSKKATLQDEETSNVQAPPPSDSNDGTDAKVAATEHSSAGDTN